MITTRHLSFLTLWTVLLCSLGVALLLAPLGCQGPAAMQQPNRAWVDASRQFHDVIGPRFVAYVQADATLDQLTRDVLVRTVSDWEFMVRQGEASIPVTAPAPAAPVARPAGGGLGGGR